MFNRVFATFLLIVVSFSTYFVIYAPDETLMITQLVQT